MRHPTPEVEPAPRCAPTRYVTHPSTHTGPPTFRHKARLRRADAVSAEHAEHSVREMVAVQQLLVSWANSACGRLLPAGGLYRLMLVG